MVLRTAVSGFLMLLVAVLPARGENVQIHLSDPVEQRLVEYVEAHNHAALEFLEGVVNINSGTMNLDGVRQVGRLFAEPFERLGFDVHWLEGAAFQRAGHLLATRPGKSGGKGKAKHVLLIGHLDTVFELDNPFQKFERTSEFVARGPGIIDMKGGDVILLQALEALGDAGILDNLTLTVLLIGDEERPGDPIALGRKALVEAADNADIAIAFENGDNDPHTGVISRRGSTSWRLHVSGKPAHSSQIFRSDIGAGAIYEASRILYGFYEKLLGEAFLTFNPGLVLGGTDVEYDSLQARGRVFGKNNVIAAQANVSGDLRSLSPEQLQQAKKHMQEIVSQHLPHTSATISFVDHYPPMAPTDGNRSLLKRLDAVSRDLGYGSMEPVDPSRAGAADVAFTAGHVDRALDGLGLLGDGEHTGGETADLRTLPMQTKRTAVLLYRIGNRLGPR